jgi:hypothetical protein
MMAAGVQAHTIVIVRFLVNFVLKPLRRIILSNLL